MKSKCIGERVFSEKAIEEGVNIVAEKLNNTFNEAVVITVVPGGILFTADLVRRLNFDLYVDFISCPHTPGECNNSSKITFDQNIDLRDKDVILVDDAIESGGTMQRLTQFIKKSYPLRSISIATLFVKPGRVESSVDEYFAYELSTDELLVGYGLPWKGKLRNIPYVSKLKK